MCINDTMKYTMYRALRPTFRLLFSPRGTICYWNSSAKLYQSLALTCSGQRNNLVRPLGKDSKLHQDIFIKIITNCCLFCSNLEPCFKDMLRLKEQLCRKRPLGVVLCHIELYLRGKKNI